MAKDKAIGSRLDHGWLTLANFLQVEFSRFTMDENDVPVDDSSSSSDDDYLTLNDSTTDRESLVRKKLLENFYGKSAVAAARPAEESIAEQDDDDDDDDMDPSQLRHGTGRLQKSGKDDIDSPDFDALAHTQRHVLHSSVHNLLDVEERLSLQIRTLDSTMQALVYENYSRFIDATDAIRSIGVNVHANEAGLAKLSERIQSVDLASKDTEETLGSLRDQVAEKIRVKRLLSRLDALLKLPQTLQAQIAAGKYRTATRSYISARTILGQHSKGFESLRTIETDCTQILQNMKIWLTKQLLHWNGRLGTDVSYDAIVKNESELADENDQAQDKRSDNDQLPQPPKTMTEIFECVGTLYILLDDGEDGIDITNKEEMEGEQPIRSDMDFVMDKDELPSMALGAATRALDRILDAHIIQVQDRRFALLGEDPSAGPLMETRTPLAAPSGDASPATPISDGQPDGAVFIPREFLDAILEVATLYGMSFSDNLQVNLLTEFISESFSSFLSHIRSILMEQSGPIQDEATDEQEQKLEPDTILASTSADDQVSTGEEEISNALTLLVQAVREMAAGLSLPEVGVNNDFTQGLVDEAMQLSDSMVNRRVHQKFNDLRVKIAKDCLIPFALKLVEQQSSPSTMTTMGALDKKSVARARAVASTTLSDCLQLVDDTIRSILAGTSGTNSRSDGTDNNEAGKADPENISAVLKEAVQDSTKEFTSWLASALEVLAGGEAWVVDVAQDIEEEMDETTNENFVAPIESSTSFGMAYGASSEMKDNETIMELIKSARLELRVPQDGGGVEIAFIIAIAEMCRLAQGSLSENLEQSMASHLGTGKRRARHMFSGGELGETKTSEDDEVTLRFRLAASRVFALYTSQKGAEAASLLVMGLESLSNENHSCDSPRATTCLALGVVKAVAMECSYIFDGPSRAGPVPELDDGMVGMSSTSIVGLKSSLQIDVERIFKEKLSIHLHPSEQMDFSRSALIFFMLKVAFRGLLESVRLFAFSRSGFKQLQIDVEFLKLMLPHYIDQDFAVQGNNACTSLSNLLSDLMEAVGQRCDDETCEHDENLKHESLALLRDFMALAVADDKTGSVFVIAEDHT